MDSTAGNPWNQDSSCGATGTGANVLQWPSSSEDGGSDLCVPNVIAADPALASAPIHNGGPTATLLPGSGCTAFGAGSGCEAVDQRGEPRDPTQCDLGAVAVP